MCRKNIPQIGYKIYFVSGIGATIFEYYLCVVFTYKIYKAMYSNAICPISTNKTDENKVRIVAGFTVLLLIVFILTQNSIPIIILLIDFVLRGFELPSLSPLAKVSGYISRILGVKKLPINVGPKIFAARIGVFFSVGILVSHLLGYETFAFVLASIFGICALLEAVFSFCLACKIYPLLYRMTYNKK